MKKTYLGDGVYVDFDGYALVLTTENGIQATNTIILEPEVYHALEAFVKALQVPPCELCGEPAGEGQALCSACGETR